MSFKKSLRNILDNTTNIKSQSTFEYTILLTIFISLTLLATNILLSTAGRSGENMFQKAIAKIIGSQNTGP